MKINLKQPLNPRVLGLGYIQDEGGNLIRLDYAGYQPFRIVSISSCGTFEVVVEFHLNLLDMLSNQRLALVQFGKHGHSQLSVSFGDTAKICLSIEIY